MRLDRWLELKRVKVFCLSLAAVFTAQQAVWGADPAALQALQLSHEQQRQLEQSLSGAVLSIYEDLYERQPTPDELKQAVAATPKP